MFHQGVSVVNINHYPFFPFSIQYSFFFTMQTNRFPNQWPKKIKIFIYINVLKKIRGLAMILLLEGPISSIIDPKRHRKGKPP